MNAIQKLIMQDVSARRTREVTMQYVVILLGSPKAQQVLAKYEEQPNTFKMVFQFLCMYIGYQVRVNDAQVMQCVFGNDLRAHLTKEELRRLCQPAMVSIVYEFEAQVKDLAKAEAKSEPKVGRIVVKNVATPRTARAKPAEKPTNQMRFSFDNRREQKDALAA